MHFCGLFQIIDELSLTKSQPIQNEHSEEDSSSMATMIPKGNKEEVGLNKEEVGLNPPILFVP